MVRHGKRRPLPVGLTLLAALWLSAVQCPAGVVVLANRAPEKVDFFLVENDGGTHRHRLEPQHLLSIPVAERIGIAYYVGAEPRRHLLEANSVYYFVDRDDELNVIKVGFPKWPNAKATPRPASPEVPPDSVATIPAMILVDDDEPAVRRIWEERLRERLSAASDILERHCRVRFEVAAVGTWVSDDRILDFEQSLQEFELNVTPAPARVAIGFTSQYRMPRGRTHLGGTRGALHSHILIREWAQHVTKAERLEVLLHELGHFLGATHSPEGTSVMRATLGDHRAHARSFRIGFDAPNTLIMNLVCEELRARGVASLAHLSPLTKARLRSIYSGLGEVLPNDPAAKHYLELLDRRAYVRSAVTYPKPLVAATRTVVQAIAEAAKENRSAGPTGTGRRLNGDRLMELYARRAAAAAKDVPPDQAAKAFLLGLGIAMDSAMMLRYSPIANTLCRQVESHQERARRLAVFGAPTMRGRRDLAQHFAVSSAVAALVGPRGAETAGVAKELRDSRGKSGFSFVDLSADIAGATFAGYVCNSKISLDRLASSFAVEDFLPDGSNLEEGIPWKDFLHEYNSAHHERFLRQQAAIRQQVLRLPGYQLR